MPAEQINKNCDTLYGSVVLEPYFMILVNTFLFMIFKIISEKFIIPCVARRLLRNRQGNNDDCVENGVVQITNPAASSITHKVEEAAADNTEADIVPAEDKHASLTFLYFQVAVSFISCLLAVVEIDADQPGWVQYTNLYGLLLNSCLVTTSVSLLLSYYDFSQQDTGATSTALMWYLLSLLPFLPILITHIIPGIIVYIWVVIIVGAVIAILSCIWICFSSCFVCFGREKSAKLKHPRSNIAYARDIQAQICSSTFSALMFEIIVRLFFVFFFQTLFNYMAIFYSYEVPISPGEYIGVIALEYSLRTETYCFFEKDISSVRTGIILFNWL